MTSKTKNPNSGPPPPITKLTIDQDFKMRKLEIALAKPETQKKDMATILLALQRQNFALCNSITNLLSKWPKDQATTNEDLSMFGILLETKD